MEKLYTIPINEAFDASQSDSAAGCPFCALHKKYNENEMDIVLGAAMMEPDIRIKMNEQGFCGLHYDDMLTRKNRLSLALILESHMAQLREEISGKGVTALLAGTGVEPVRHLARHENSCYICGRVKYHFDRVMQNAVAMWNEDEQFKKKFAAQPYFCLPHYKSMLEYAKHKLNKKNYAEFYRAASHIVLSYFDALRGDVSWFCKKFDYRYESEPWHNSKDALERAAKFLKGDLQN